MGRESLCECCDQPGTKVAFDPDQGDLWFCDECYEIVTAEVESRA